MFQEIWEGILGFKEDNIFLENMMSSENWKESLNFIEDDIENW